MDTIKVNNEWILKLNQDEMSWLIQLMVSGISHEHQYTGQDKIDRSKVFNSIYQTNVVFAQNL